MPDRPSSIGEYSPAMASISKGRIRELLEGPHQAVLSVGREDKGPVAVPMSYTYNGDRLFFVTSPTSLHGRLMGQAGRATLTIQFEEVGTGSVHQWYVMAEGRMFFTDADPAPHVRAMLTKDRGSQNWDRWPAAEPNESEYPRHRVAEQRRISLGDCSADCTGPRLTPRHAENPRIGSLGLEPLRPAPRSARWSR
jgi:nitroimidazol reductase NimA-like FMN-containing flavoprotein (pyridoxamine 5'-phosphate oxidase superfamily)